MNLKPRTDTLWAAAVAFFAGTVFYFSAKAPHLNFDYTYRIALALLGGHAGLKEHPGSWLNELVPFGGKFYSVFPLGAVLANMPAALLRKMGLIQQWPARGIAALIAAMCVYFFHRLSHVAQMSQPRRILMALFPIFATWAWCNLGFAGAWQIALGCALLGGAASLYYTLVRRSPLLAGLWFALAFGNRTELLLTTPIYLYFLWQTQPSEGVTGDRLTTEKRWRRTWMDQVRFLAVPALLLLCTAAYNYARFHSPTDFGYARIPGVLKEPWYQHGLFSWYAIPWNVHKMLFEGVADMPQFPYIRFYPFGCSIFMASPFLFLLFREGGKHRAASWLAISGLTLILWFHGNPGGWQFSYRYAMILLPWMFLIILENGPRRLTATEATLFLVSVFLNAIAVYEFLWSSIIHV
jgi:hypothetical protein